MNVNLKRRFQFATGLVYQEEFQVNSYDVMLSMLTVSTDHDEQNIAYERMKYWVNRVLYDSVLISETSERLSAYQSTGQRLVILPEEPVDQLVGMMLYLKLNAVMENRMVVTGVELSSEVGENMIYSHAVSENLGPLQFDGWWSDARPVWNDAKKRPSGSNIIELDRMPEWGDLELDWHKDQVQEKNTVVFADFNNSNKHEDK